MDRLHDAGLDVDGNGRETEIIMGNCWIKGLN